MNAVAIIPARGGSRRIPRKNIRPFHGRAILAYSIEAALQSGLFDMVLVSSEDQEILRTARSYGATPLEREMKLAFDDVGTQAVAADALVELELGGIRPTFACCVYPTVPMLRAQDLRNGYELMGEINDYAYVVGWFYWGRSEWFGRKPLQEQAPMEIESERWIDINVESDWKRAEEMYSAFFAKAPANVVVKNEDVVNVEDRD